VRVLLMRFEIHTDTSRMDMQYHAIQMILKKLILCPINKLQNILDLGAGTGEFSFPAFVTIVTHKYRNLGH
jgi:hypothetical protein